MSAEDWMVRTVAVGTDGSGTADKAVEFALELARRFDARIVFISAYMPVPEARLRREARDAPEDLQWTINPAEDVDATLRDCEDRAEQQGLHWASEAREGDPAKILVELAASNNADVLVIGNKGMHRRVLGSVPNTVSHHAPCSVVIVKTT
jgi:nucleotide-binding universal stress UspA family protein